MYKYKVSVIVPVYNTSTFLPQCLESLISQSLEKIEIICVDNGSTDNSLAILNDYGARFSNIVVIEHPFGLQGGARNAGISVANGEFIGFVDSDDSVHSDMFSILFNLAKSGSAEISLCNIEVNYINTGTKKNLINPSILSCNEAFHISGRPLLLRNLTICNKLFSAEFLKGIDLKFPIGLLHEDQYFVASALLNAQKIISYSGSLYYYKKDREGSVSSQLGKNALDIFPVMELFNDNYQGREPTSALINELKISRYLQLFNSTSGKIRFIFFRRLKSKLNYISIQATPVLLTKSEYMEYRFIKNNNYVFIELFYFLRSIYGRLRFIVNR